MGEAEASDEETDEDARSWWPSRAMCNGWPLRAMWNGWTSWNWNGHERTSCICVGHASFLRTPCMDMGPAGGLPPRFMRRMVRCGNPARRMHRRQEQEEMKKAKNADTEDVIGQSESDETPLNDWVELKKDINEME